jgi:signal transduction histidine kinase
MSRSDIFMLVGGRRLALTNQTFRQVIVAAVKLGFAAVAVAGGAALLAVARDLQLTALVDHSNAVQVELAQLRGAVEQGEAARRGYIITLSPEGRQVYERANAEAISGLTRLKTLTRDSPSQKRQLSEVEQALQGLFGNQKWSVDLAAKGDQPAATRLFREDTGESIGNVRSRIAEVTQSEQALLSAREAAQRAAVGNLYLALWIAAPLLVLVGAGSTLVIFRYTHDLSRTSEALRSLNAGLEAAVAERTEDLARANQEIQRFAYIVSHDLRSPLVNIMGFTAELQTSLKPLTALVDRLEAEAPDKLSSEAAFVVRDEAPEALGFIRKSTQKMDRLINAILELSRSGRRPLRPEALEPSRLIADVAATLLQKIEQAGAELVISPDLPGIVSDRLAVEQVFQNLIENAVKYLKPGRPGRIDITGERLGGFVAIAVADNGRGIDARDHERIFELFRRSGHQDQPGEGIGLAAVRAIVYRMGGRITVDSALDQGAVFRVLLPAVLKSDREVAA